MLSVKKLNKNFALNTVITDAAFSAEIGDVVGFLGLNGAGKTTTLQMLSSYLAPTSGEITIDGKLLSKEVARIRPLIGYLPETPPLYPELTVTEYLRFIAAIRKVPNAKEAVSKIIERCALEVVAKKVCGTLSKGFRARVGLAQAIIHKPKLLLLDEPTSGLDAEQIQVTREIITEMKQDSAVILSTHVFAEVSALCNKVVIIHEGKILLEQSLNDRSAEGIEQSFLQIVRGESHA